MNNNPKDDWSPSSRYSVLLREVFGSEWGTSIRWMRWWVNSPVFPSWYLKMPPLIKLFVINSSLNVEKKLSVTWWSVPDSPVEPTLVYSMENMTNSHLRNFLRNGLGGFTPCWSRLRMITVTCRGCSMTMIPPSPIDPCLWLNSSASLCRHLFSFCWFMLVTGSIISMQFPYSERVGGQHLYYPQVISIRKHFAIYWPLYPLQTLCFRISQDW